MTKRTPLRLIQLIIALLLIVLVGIIFTKLSSDNDRGNVPVSLNASPAPSADETKVSPAPSERPKPKQGRISIITLEAESALPVSNAEYAIEKASDGSLVETVRTGPDGLASSALLDYGSSYTVRQTNAPVAYTLADRVATVAIDAPSHALTIENKLKDYVKGVSRSEDGSVSVTSVYLDVDVVMQMPELPNGCEITSLTALLNYWGYAADKLDMADNYLPKESWVRKDGKLFGPDPYQYYAGDPRLQPGGFFSFAAPIVVAADSYMSDVDGTVVTTDISGSTRDELVGWLNEGIPLAVWTTLDMSPPKINFSWYFHDTGEFYEAPVNLHVVVLNGYDAEANIVHVMNPLEGQVTYNADTFFNSYAEMGSHALAAEPR